MHTMNHLASEFDTLHRFKKLISVTSKHLSYQKANLLNFLYLCFL